MNLNSNETKLLIFVKKAFTFSRTCQKKIRKSVKQHHIGASTKKHAKCYWTGKIQVLNCFVFSVCVHIFLLQRLFAKILVFYMLFHNMQMRNVLRFLYPFILLTVDLFTSLSSATSEPICNSKGYHKESAHENACSTSGVSARCNPIMPVN